jgi:hypothetical protein
VPHCRRFDWPSRIPGHTRRRPRRYIRRSSRYGPIVKSLSAERSCSRPIPAAMFWICRY